MKPKYLEIEGFRSYIQKVKIDFEKLSKFGLFGIFGKTGSGKSSIIDAMIYAIYGKTGKKLNIEDLINKDSENGLKVLFKFSINENDYEIERKVKKRKSNTNSSVRLMKNGKVIAEKDGEVKAVLGEIFPISREDFLKSIVLLQGEFASFLTGTDPSDRKKMLERIFDLTKYGERLKRKILDTKNEIDKNLANIEGELKPYNDTNQSIIREIEKELSETTNKLEDLKRQESNQDKKTGEYRELLKIKNDLTEKEKRLKDLLNQKDEMEELRTKYIKGNKILPLIELEKEVEKINKNIQGEEAKLNKINKDLEKLQHDVELKKNEYGAKFAMDETEASLQIKELQNVLEKMEDIKYSKKNKGKLELQLNNLNDSKIQKEGILNGKIEERTTVRAKMQEIQDKLSGQKELYEREGRIKELRALKKTINEKINILKEKMDKQDEKLEDIEKEEIEIKTIESNLKDIEKILEQKNSELPDIEKLNEKNLELSRLEDSIKKSKNDIERKKDIEVKLKETLRKKQILKNELSKLNGELEGLHENHRLNIIRELTLELEDGKPCPVCGSIHHPAPAKIELKNDKNFNEKDLSEKVKNLEEKIRKLDFDENILKNDMNNLEKAKDLDFLLKRNRILQNELEELKNFKSRLETDIKDMNEKKINLERNKATYTERLKADKKRIEELKKDIQDLQNSTKELNDKLEIAMEENKIKDIELELSKIEEQKIVYENLSTENKKLHSKADGLDKEIEVLKNELFNIEKDISTTHQKIDDAKKHIEKYEMENRGVLNKYSVGNPEEEIKHLENYINEKRKMKESIEKLKSDIFEKEKEINECKTVIKMLKASFEENKSKLERKMLEQLITVEELKGFNLTNEDLHNYEEELKKYDKDLNTVQNEVDYLRSKLGGREINESLLNEAEERLRRLRSDISSFTSKVGLLENDLKDKKEKLQKKNELEKELKAIKDKFEIYEELYSMVKGNSLSGYVSSLKTRHLIKDASRTLGNISNDRYSFYIDNEAKIFIRDNFYGGELRKPSSLSGGELFMASLSLALAISSQIQLKGKTHIDFFFVDEGFSSLDKESLKLVMKSLERLRSDKMTIGLISHLDDIKEWVPVKLVVKGNELGGSGSTVKIEYS